jgi:ribosome-binding protein aMBF1 (putative translation factor)
MMKRTNRDRPLTSEEAAKYNAIREEIEAEKPEINSRIRNRLADKKKEKAAQSDSQTLGQHIRAAREALGESQVSLAAAAGISQGYLSQLEADEREPTLSIAARLANALGISLDKLASGAA